MLIRLFEQATAPERRRLRQTFAASRARRTVADVSWVRERMDAYDCIGYARQVAQGLAGAAAHEFELLYAALPDSRDKQFIAALPTWVIERA
jgi:geranylgeranyl diphosphate synthase type II